METPRVGRIPREHRPSRALSPGTRAALVLLGTAGLVALAVAVVGPKRIRRTALDLRDAVEPHAEKAWADKRQLRDQIAAAFERASPDARKAMARTFQSWIGHFRAD
jgi:hypothetical protein